MANLMTTLRRKAPSKRAMLAIGGAAAITVGGIAQTADTMAADTDSATANVSQISSQNFYPTPLPTGNISCNSPNPTVVGAKFSWASAGPGMSYKVTVWSGTSVKAGPWFQTETERTIKWNYEGGDTYHFAVQVVNNASGSTNESRVVSSGELRHALYHNGLNTTSCSGNPWRNENASWENQSSWTPAAPVYEGRGGVVTDGASENAMKNSAPSTGDAKPSSTESEKPTTPSTSESGLPSDPSASETSTPPPASSTESSEPAPAGDVTIAIDVAGEQRRVRVMVDGVRKCAIPLEKGDVPNVGNNQVTITNGDSVRLVDLDSCPNAD